MLGKKELREVVNIGIDLTTEKNRNRLLNKILTKAMDITNCDAGTLYLYRDQKLEFKIMRTISKGICKGADGEDIDLPPVPLNEGNVCAYAALRRELVNIPDVDASDRFDFSGPRHYDEITGYHTASMLVIPMEDAESELVGVLQLINKYNGEGKIEAFTEDDEFVICALGSMAAVSLSNMIYIEEIKQQLTSFALAFATAIDERTPYNGSHTRNVTRYVGILTDYINKKYRRGECGEYFDDNRKEQLELAAAMHDIGKMIVPLAVMNKESRLDCHLDKVEDRFRFLAVCYERDMLKGRISAQANEAVQIRLEEYICRIRKYNKAEFLSKEEIGNIEEIASHTYIQEDGQKIPYLTEYEKKCLSIAKGTLTEEERRIMESHVIMTAKILDKVHFHKRYSNIPRFAAYHHEALDGSGYPNHLKGDQLELEPRILAVVDVYDALTSSNRPYRSPVTGQQAFKILHSMAEEGKLEDRLVTWLEEALEENRK